jgi:hypothetical protein
MHPDPLTDEVPPDRLTHTSFDVLVFSIRRKFREELAGNSCVLEFPRVLVDLSVKYACVIALISASLEVQDNSRDQDKQVKSQG